MGALLALVPFRDWLYGAVIVAAGLFAWHTYHKYEVAVTYAATVKTESAAAQAAAAANVLALTQAHAQSIVEIQEKQNVDLQAAAARSADLASRLRQYQAHRCPVAVLPGAAPATPAGTAAAPSVDDAIAGVIAAAEHDLVILGAERDERDSLTGK